MKLNVEINAKTSWEDDKLRRILKQRLIDTIGGAIADVDYAELNSLMFVVPKTKTSRKRKTS
jgi:hypothetical protein